MEEAQKAESPAPPPPSPEPKDQWKGGTRESKGKPREARSREVSMTPVEEDHDEDTASRTSVDVTKDSKKDSTITVTQVAPTQKAQSRNKKRTVETFMNVDIPGNEAETEADSEETGHNSEDNGPTVEDSHQMNKDDENKSVADDSEATTPRAVDGREQLPTDGRSRDLAPIDGMPNTTTESEQERSGPERAVSTDHQEHEITEDGGDHEGFKEQLKEELERMSQEDTDNQAEDTET